MAIVKGFKKCLSLRVVGTVGPKKLWNKGEISYTEAKKRNKWSGTYQKRKCKQRTETVLMRYYKPSNPRTQRQQLHRFIFKAGVHMWQEMDNDSRALYNFRGKKLRLTGYTLFLREWLNEHKS